MENAGLRFSAEKEILKAEETSSESGLRLSPNERKLWHEDEEDNFFLLPLFTERTKSYNPWRCV